MKPAVFFFIAMFTLCASLSKAGAQQCTIKPEVGSPGDVVTIQGDFGDKQDNSYVVLSDKTPEKLEILSWEKDKIRFVIPPRSNREIVNVTVYVNGEPKYTAEMQLGLYGIDLVEEAIKLKRSNMQEPAIVDHLAYVSRVAGDRGRDPKGYFGKYPLPADQMVRLRKEGFQNDFIAKFEGQPQHVTLGIAMLWLGKTANVVYAPIVRIFLKPRSYFHPYSPYFHGRWGLSRCGLLQADRWDLNIGYTTNTSTTESNEAREKEHYVLIGLSNQLNRSALLNIGYALLPGDTKYVDSQFYVGFTLDSNFLKEIGLMNK